jgi:hypothetical protein
MPMLETTCPNCARTVYYLLEAHPPDRLVHCLNCKREIEGLVGQEMPTGIQPVGGNEGQKAPAK